MFSSKPFIIRWIWEEWENPINGTTANEQYQKDLLKETVARNQGFLYYICWSSDNFIQILETWKSIILSNIK